MLRFCRPPPPSPCRPPPGLPATTVPEGMTPSRRGPATARPGSRRPRPAAGLAGRYGYHRDELYFLACGRHLTWGYADQPPLTPALAHLADLVAPGSLTVLRLPAALAAVAVTLLAALTARELGGDRFAQLLAALATGTGTFVLASGHGLFTSTPDLAIGVTLIWLAVRALARAGRRNWLAQGSSRDCGLLQRAAAGLHQRHGARGRHPADPARPTGPALPLAVGRCRGAPPSPGLRCCSGRPGRRPAAGAAGQHASRVRHARENRLLFVIGQVALFSIGAGYLWTTGLIRLWRGRAAAVPGDARPGVPGGGRRLPGDRGPGLLRRRPLPGPDRGRGGGVCRAAARASSHGDRHGRGRATTRCFALPAACRYCRRGCSTTRSGQAWRRSRCGRRSAGRSWSTRWRRPTGRSRRTGAPRPSSSPPTTARRVRSTSSARPAGCPRRTAGTTASGCVGTAVGSRGRSGRRRGGGRRPRPGGLPGLWAGLADQDRGNQRGGQPGVGLCLLGRRHRRLVHGVAPPGLPWPADPATPDVPRIDDHRRSKVVAAVRPLAAPGAAVTTSIVVLTEQALGSDDVARLVRLHAEDRPRYRVLVPADARRNLLADVLDHLSLLELRAGSGCRPRPRGSHPRQRRPGAGRVAGAA